MREGEMGLLYEEDTFRILGACFEVYKEKGCGFLEAVYQECLALEFGLQHISFVPKAELKLTYKDLPLVQTYQPDFILFDKIILEIKALTALANEHRAQLHNNIKATGLRVGLLVNFGHHPKVEHERIIR